ncbi:BRO family protein [Sphingopyxis sp. PAMC25046]|uniref:BRO-N domain-containing protein n=1 Tax=Sphingopyxis sp. PAMC25046 TaxID=2565556 RepID=UPI001FFBF1F0|nr:BRO family protein [Sphingopyxis sp. PAMC25046]
MILNHGDGFAWRKSEPHVTLITESGLYKLIMRSDKAEAVEFQNWVTREVLPAIRRTGDYVMQDADVEAVLDQQPSNPARAEVDLLGSVMSTIEAMKALVEEKDAALAEKLGNSPLRGVPAINPDYRTEKPSAPGSGYLRLPKGSVWSP